MTRRKKYVLTHAQVIVIVIVIIVIIIIVRKIKLL